MLTSLHIENIAVIRKADVDFTSGFCVLTGETGAGKSLLIDSINLLMGGRVSRDLISAGEEKATVSAMFWVDAPHIITSLAEYGVEADEGEVMLQRVIMRDGKSQARVNGRAVTQSMLKEVGSLLVNIHGQSDNQKLMQSSAHRELLDAYAQESQVLEAYAQAYTAWKATCDQLTRLRGDLAQRIRTRDMLVYQIQDIDAAKLKAGEEEKLLERKARLQHQEKIQRQVTLSLRALHDGEKATVSLLLGRVESALGQLTTIIPTCEELLERVSAMKYEAEDIADTLRELCDMDMQDPTAEIDRIESRLDVIARLARKYGENVSEILAFRGAAAARLEEIDTADQRIEALEAEEVKLRAVMQTCAQQLTQVRKNAAHRLAEEVREALAFLDMPKVIFEVAVTPLTTPAPHGNDGVEFMISTNPGEPVAPMVKIASGGELSRIMLALRSVLNRRYGVPTAIYDEVDTGISGRTARKVGIKLAEIAKATQVICVTHSAQIASLAETHYVIEKHQEKERTHTTVRQLSKAQRVDEIARILGGLDVTDSQRKAALELMGE